MENLIPWDSIQAHLQNPHEPYGHALSVWLSERPENKVLLHELKVTYAVSGNLPGIFEPDQELAWKKITNRIRTSMPVKRPVRMLMRIAASILLILVGAGAAWWAMQPDTTFSYTEVYSPFGHKTMIVLPDSSKVWLNGNTRLKYRNDYLKRRQVELTGQGLFEVMSDKDNRFTVQSPNLRTEVLGTVFNLKDYPEDRLAEVTLVEGKVEIYKDKQHLKELSPSERLLFFPEEGRCVTRKANVDQIISWSRDELILENESLENVVKYLERWYGVSISLDKELKGKHRLSFKVKAESLLELLSIINHITPIDYQIEGKNVRIRQLDRK